MASGQLVAVSSVWRLQIQRPLYYLVQVVVNSAITLYLQTCHINKIDLDFTTKLRFWALVSQSMTQVYQFEVDSYESNHPHIKSFSSWGDPRRYSHQRYEAKHRVFEAGHWLCTTGAVGQRINVHGAFHVVTRNLTFLQKRSREREREIPKEMVSLTTFLVWVSDFFWEFLVSYLCFCAGFLLTAGWRCPWRVPWLPWVGSVLLCFERSDSSNQSKHQYLRWTSSSTPLSRESQLFDRSLSKT